MKKLVFVMTLLGATLFSQAQFSKATLQATGLTCAMCSNAINKALEKVPFIGSVKADIKNSAFAISFKEGAEVNIDALKDAVEDAGFSIGKLELTGNFSELQIEKDKHVKLGNGNFHFINVPDQVLNGEKVVTVVDKNFVTEKQFKKQRSLTKMKCMETGKAEACCVNEGLSAEARVYHVTI
jgi:copper chaperone CopZ